MSEKEEQVEKDLETTEEPLTEPSEEEIDAAGLSEAEVEKSEIDSLKEKNNELEEDQAVNLKKGVEMVLESLRQALKEEGIEEIPAEGETFDPNLHQAVQTVPATEDVPADTIVTVLQKGYKLHDRVLRASMVIVAQ